jgi:TRAP-type mannitol/chloroaromatic compound transport system permease small subunit
MVLKLCHCIDALNRFIGKLASFLCIALILLVVQQVISRYAFKSSSIAMTELEWHIFGVIFLFSMGWTLEKEGHVRVDIIYGMFSKKVKALVNIFGVLFFLMPICGLVIYFGIEFSMDAMEYPNPRPHDYYTVDLFSKESSLYKNFSSVEGYLRKNVLFGELSSDPGGLEGRWLIKACLPLAFILLGLQAISMLLKNILILFKKKK